MSTPSDIEKKSLEAHVELCAQRYMHLEEKLETVETDVKSVKAAVEGLNEMLSDVVNKRNDQLINWGIGIIVFLVGVIGYLLKSHLQ